MDAGPPSSARILGPTAFVAALLLRAGAVLAAVRPPEHGRLDTNLYLEGALHLWRDGTYGSQVATTYPPLTSLFFAPTFGIGDIDTRLAVLALMQVALLGLASLALLPMLTEAVGRRSAWLCLAAAQLLAGGTWHALEPRSETLFSALVLAAVGLVWGVAKAPTPARVGGLAATVVLAISCRRIGVVLPVAVGLPLLTLAWPTLRRRGLTGASPLLLAAAVGAGLGAVPELGIRWLHGGGFSTYHDPWTGHLRPLVSMWTDPDTLNQAVIHLARQPLYLVLAFGGAPLVLAAALLLRGRSPRLPRPLRAAAATALLLGLGLSALSGLHILRYGFKRGLDKAFQLYPRYLDPAEAPIVLCGVAVAAWMVAAGPPRLGRRMAGWVGLVAFLAWRTGPLSRPRGFRLVWRQDLDGAPWLVELYPFLWPTALVVVASAVALLLASRRAGGPALVLLAVIAGWAMSFHLPGLMADRANRPTGVHPLVHEGPLADDPRAPVAIVLDHLPAYRRDLLAPAFRSDHDVYWVAPEDLAGWQAAHPGGYLLTHKWPRRAVPAPGMAPIHRSTWWTVWGPSTDARPTGEPPPPRPSPPPRPRSPAPAPPG